MPGWSLVAQEKLSAAWRDAAGDVISLTYLADHSVADDLDDDGALQQYSRDVAESQRAGLVEVATVDGGDGPYLTYIYTRLEGAAFRFFGVAESPRDDGTWIWMIVAGERGTSGVREAVVTAQLLKEGKLTPESYRTSWAGDPYDATYSGVDRSTMRYRSDSSEFDAMFPDHPLSKVRRELARLAAIRLPPTAV